MNLNEYIEEFGENINYDIDSVNIDDGDVFDNFNEPLKKWWVERFGQYVQQNNGLFTEPQKESIPNIINDKNTLIASPTGSGKTLAAFSGQINKLLDRSVNGDLENKVYCIYISPLKSLANDIKRNLELPLNGVQRYASGEADQIRQSIRHGDTPQKERQKMLEETPHILNTTPETLAILLNSPKFKKKLEAVETVIVDEIHSLASNKRGTHLSVSLERLEQMSNNNITRIGCSATVEPLEEIAEYLVGYDTDKDESRNYEIVDTRFVRDTELSVITPVNDLINTSQEKISSKLYESLHSEISDHNTTIVFTNTRSGAESTLSNLQNRFSEYNESNSAVHHSSLGKDKRKTVEDKLKKGDLDVVTTSTSLELGIDMNDIDLVVQIGSPKSISSLLQRIGRAGHQLGETVEGKLYVLNQDELVECTVMAEQAKKGYIDRIFVPHNCHDVLVQHIYGIAINSVRSEDEVFDIIKSSKPYNNYSRSMFNNVLKYMSAEYDGMEDRNIYPKIWRDTNDSVNGEHHYSEYPVGEKLIGRSGRKARMIYYTNIGTIPDTFSCTVHIRDKDKWVGELDEEYLNTLSKGDVFQLGGNNYEYRYRRGSKVYVDRTSEAPTVPSWFSERLPLNYDLGNKILEFQECIVKNIMDQTEIEFLENYPIDENTKDSIINLYREQYEFMDKNKDCISTQDIFVIEKHTKSDSDNIRYYFQSCYGRKFNDGLSRIIAQYIADEIEINVQIAVEDQGFSIEIPNNQDISMPDILEKIKPHQIKNMLKRSLEKTDFLKRYFRINATRSLMILRNYKGNHKSAKEQQVRSEMLLGFADKKNNFIVLEETYREIMEDKLDLNKIKQFIRDIENDNVNIIEKNVSVPSPRSFSIAALASNDVVKTENQSEALEKYHKRVLEKIKE